jgi:N-acyl-L-homoserine lactone synthetase
MSRLDPTAATAKWVQNLSNATQHITDGVNAVQTAPGQAAARQVQTWLARIQASAQKWATNVSAVTLSEWQQAMIQTGIPRISQGAQQKQGKYQAFAVKFFPYLASGQAQVRAMPKVTLQDGINRAVAMINHNAKFSNKAS